MESKSARHSAPKQMDYYTNNMLLLPFSKRFDGTAVLKLPKFSLVYFNGPIVPKYADASSQDYWPL